MFDLKQTQDIFWRLMQAPQGISKLSQGNIPLAEIFLEHRPGEAVERLDNYSQMYFWRLSDSLREDFPITAAVLGEEEFHRVLVEYLLQSPSRFRDLAELSGAFSESLEKHLPVPTGSNAFLVELAKLEWLTLKVQRQKNSRPLTPDILMNLAPEAWGQLALKRVEASEVLPVHWDLFNFWKKSQDWKGADRIVAPKPKEGHLLIWRKGFTPMVLEISPLEAHCLEILKKPLPFQELCEKIAQENPQEASVLAASFLQGWIDRQLVERY